MNIKCFFIKLVCCLSCIVLLSSFFIPIIVNASVVTDSANKVVLNSEEDIENNIDETLYPGYKEKLLALKKLYPNWSFTLYFTGIDWETAITNESTGLHSRSLVQDKAGEWLCDSCGTTVYDKGGWMCASKKAVAFLMDVRNYLSASYIFQFEELSYNPDTYTIEGIEKILNGTFMYNKSIRDYYNNQDFDDVTFAEAIMEAANLSGVSPYHLASRMRQELGVNGSNSIYGTYSGYEGYFNFYNICAYSGEDPIGNGLKFASDSSSGKYLLPWNDPVKAIKGGAIWIAQNYIAVGQNTLYFEKFDVVSNGTYFYNHQYMQNIFAAKNEGYSTYKAYKNLGLLDNNFNFIIPVYENMPNTLSQEPNSVIELNENVQVSAYNVNLRESPNTSSKILNTLAKGTKLIRLQKNVITADGFSWDKVKLDDGTIGYMASNYLELVNETLQNQAEETKEEIVQNKVVEENKQEEIVQNQVTEETKKEETTQNKANEEVKKEETVQVQNKEKTAVINMKNVNIRKSPTTKGKKIKTLAKGTKVTIIEEKVKYANGYYWDKVRLSNGTVGYVASKFLTVSNSSTSSNTAKTNQRNVNVRKSPTTKSKRIKTLAKGTKVTILSKKVKYANGYYWDKVRLSNGTVGYIASKYLS